MNHFGLNSFNFLEKANALFVSRKVVFWKPFFKFSVFVCHYKSWSTKNTFQSKKNLARFSRKCFPFYFGWKTLFKSCENLEVSCYLPIILNSILKLLIAIYFVLNFFFSISSLRIWFLYQLWFLFLWLLIAFLLSLSIKFDSHSFNFYLFYLK